MSNPTTITPTPIPVATAHLTSRQLPGPVATVVEEADCQRFDGAQCAELRWEPLSGLRSGEFTRIRIAPSDPNILYATLDANDMSVWKSTDAGATWQRVSHNGHSSDIIVHPTNPNIALYSILENNVYRTQDSGRSWRTVLTVAAGYERGETQFNALVQAASQPSIMYTATGGVHHGFRVQGGTSNIYRSSDVGVSWDRVWTGTGIGAVFSLAVLEFPFSSSSHLYRGLFRDKSNCCYSDTNRITKLQLK